jgi:hypothetical protein
MVDQPIPYTIMITATMATSHSEKMANLACPGDIG